MSHYTTAREFERTRELQREVRDKAHNAGLETFKIPDNKRLVIYLRSKLGYAEISPYSYVHKLKWWRTKNKGTKFSSFNEAMIYLSFHPRTKAGHRANLKILKMRLEVSIEDIE